MKLKLFSWKKESKTIKEQVTPEVIKSAYNKRSTEIESLRKYDRGEKTINPRNLESLVRSL
jgi:hypothetical protein